MDFWDMDEMKWLWELLFAHGVNNPNREMSALSLHHFSS
jgi:hypothetical protein